jgi:hypothetical protein
MRANLEAQVPAKALKSPVYRPETIQQTLASQHLLLFL